MALTLFEDGAYNIGVHDLEHGVLNRITSGGDSLKPAWTPDGARVTYQSHVDGTYNHYSLDADGSGRPECHLPVGQGYIDSDPVCVP